MPKSLLLSLAWFLSRGPYCDWQGNDALIQALLGVAYSVGRTDEPPVLPHGPAPQIVGGVTGFIAVMAGLIGEAYAESWRRRCCHRC